MSKRPKPTITLKCTNKNCTVKITEYYKGDEDIIIRDLDGKALCPWCESKTFEVAAIIEYEKWKGIGNKYYISSRGRVKKINKTGTRYIKPQIQCGSEYVFLYMNKKSVRFKIEKLMKLFK